ncbi:hypothetical protein B0T14DRAFT_572795 [Immersiella caudata]|uniref:Uncharacterized protein n=1 Tax=Immersiella caudata TaxID=314043 RepID=A0AA39XEB4_9PEZI|nr:hypothetical protein B0T14DRAFT_572795 [Immersiella caudata]
MDWQNGGDDPPSAEGAPLEHPQATPAPPAAKEGRLGTPDGFSSQAWRIFFGLRQLLRAEAASREAAGREVRELRQEIARHTAEFFNVSLQAREAHALANQMRAAAEAHAAVNQQNLEAAQRTVTAAAAKEQKFSQKQDEPGACLAAAPAPAAPYVSTLYYEANRRGWHNDTKRNHFVERLSPYFTSKLVSVRPPKDFEDLMRKYEGHTYQWKRTPEIARLGREHDTGPTLRPRPNDKSGRTEPRSHKGTGGSAPSPAADPGGDVIMRSIKFQKRGGRPQPSGIQGHQKRAKWVSRNILNNRKNKRLCLRRGGSGYMVAEYE